MCLGLFHFLLLRINLILHFGKMRLAIGIFACVGIGQELLLLQGIVALGEVQFLLEPIEILLGLVQGNFQLELLLGGVGSGLAAQISQHRVRLCPVFAAALVRLSGCLRRREPGAEGAVLRR